MKKKLLLVLASCATLIILLIATYPYASHLLQAYSIDYTHYTPNNIEQEVDTSSMPPAQAVPILMYHGVVNQLDEDNTEISHFISQMEMLKRRGYETITLQQFDLFLRGKYTLPPKPVILTFDDGRKDSYYPTDDIFKQLGFTATIFMVSGKANDNDPFYLSWEELRTMKNSGRWDIQPHGTYSHNRIVIDEQGTIGRFLSSRTYSPEQGLESVDDFINRIENDYLKNISDLRTQLGVNPIYYAIPLNEYGNNLEVSNFPEASKYNHELIQQYFRLAFIEGYIYTPGDPYSPIYDPPIYNYRDIDPYHISRLEVKNMSTDELQQILEDNAPKKFPYTLDTSDIVRARHETHLSYGTATFETDGIHLFSTPDSSTSLLSFGDSHWQDYTIEAYVQRLSGRSLVILPYMKDNNNTLAVGFTDNGIFLREIINSEETDLKSPSILPFISDSPHLLKIVIKDSKVTVSFDKNIIFSNVPVTLKSGKVGFKVWDDKGHGESVLQKVNITKSD